jgi:K+-sensing histidine kinase KdpD
VFLIVALVSGKLAADLRQRQQEIQGLYRFSKRLAACFTTSDLIGATESYLSESLGRRAVLIDGERIGYESDGNIAVPKSVQCEAQAIISGDDCASRTIVDVATGQVWLVRPVLLGPMKYAVFVNLGAGAIAGGRRLQRHIDNIVEDAADSLRRLDLGAAIEELRLQAQADSMRTALAATMSHELRSPLVSILGAASVLDQIAAVRQDIRARSLIETVLEEAVRLDDNIKNLIEAARITAGEVRSAPELCDPVDMVRVAIELKKTKLAGHKMEVRLAPNLPLVRVQSALIENALAQLLDNAAKYSPVGSTIEIDGRVDRHWLVLSVIDQGVGLTPDEAPHVGQRSFRGARHVDAISGSGLGLWIANTFVIANGGRLDAESAGEGLGTTVHIRLPATPDANQRQ